MPLSHNNVTATVSLTGLALGCYNKSTQNYEVGLIRQKTHTLTIEVTKKLAGGDSVMKFTLDKNHRIFIDAENAILPENPIYMDGENFSRSDDTHDKEDFRWVIDFEKELNNGNPVTLQRPEELVVTEMYVSKPTLYADRLLMSADPFLLVTIDPTTNGPVNEAPKDFGLFTEGIKADIRCQNGGAVILRVDGPQGFQIHLPHGSAAPHEIVIENICPPKANGTSNGANDEEAASTTGGESNGADTEFIPSDFSLYYSLIVDTDGKKFDLKPSNPDEEGEGAVCNGSSLGSRASLFPLPASSS